MSFLFNARNTASMLNTSIKTKRPAKNSSVAHSTRCRMISKSWMSARTKSQSAPKIAIQPERENKKYHLTSPFIARKHVRIHKTQTNRFIRLLTENETFIKCYTCSHWAFTYRLYHYSALGSNFGPAFAWPTRLLQGDSKLPTPKSSTLHHQW